MSKTKVSVVEASAINAAMSSLDVDVHKSSLGKSVKDEGLEFALKAAEMAADEAADEVADKVADEAAHKAVIRYAEECFNRDHLRRCRSYMDDWIL